MRLTYYEMRSGILTIKTTWIETRGRCDDKAPRLLRVIALHRIFSLAKKVYGIIHRLKKGVRENAQLKSKILGFLFHFIYGTLVVSIFVFFISKKVNY